MTPNSPCPIFAKSHCPSLRKGFEFHHRTQTCEQGKGCVSQSCDLRHLPNCHRFIQGWCGFIDPKGISRRFKSSSYFHPPNIQKIPPLSAVNPQRGDNSNNLDATEHDVISEAQVERVHLENTL